MPLAFGSTIGILGGGQLARMMCMAAARLGYRTHIFDPDSEAPAAQVSNKHTIASYDNEKELESFANSCDVVSYEFENVPVTCVQIINKFCAVHPGIKALKISQDRLLEKDFLNNNQIRTAFFKEINAIDDLKTALQTFENRGILKTRRLGYDGKGQVVLHNPMSDKLPEIYAPFNGVASILESFVPFEREFSLIAARGSGGQIEIYDPSENVHINGILRSSTVPATIEQEALTSAKKIVEIILNALEYQGVIGVEFFLMKDNTVLVNEIAPRVHNSGHWTEAACLISQFEQHIRAISGMPLGATLRHSNCIMQNLIGSDINNILPLSQNEHVMLHHYGKFQIREGRKMGHFTKLRPLNEKFN